MEKWVDIKGYEGMYMISDQGNIKALPKYVPYTHANGKQCYRAAKEQIMVPHDNGNGYQYITLRKNKVRKNYYVHRLVAEAFCEHPAGCDYVDHINNVKTDNRAENLQWLTQKANILKSVRNMRVPRRRFKATNTGHKYIRFRENRYRFCFKSKSEGIKNYTSHKTLEEALARREAVLSGTKYYAGIA